MLILSGKIVGKNLDLGSAFKNYNKNKVAEVFSKYSARVICYKTTLEKKSYIYKVKLKVNLVNKVHFETIGRAKVANQALDIAVILISKRVRRYLRKIKKKRIGRIKNNFEKIELLLNK
ncbi:HPF/RaiA family ribosome-associated protein [Alphaproteobacteria bacterium]|nr:HPF/RaiA family ribosome-associated protein [Alphaproteobacteria bacterium]